MSIHSRQAADRSRRASPANPSIFQRGGRLLENWFHEHVFGGDSAQRSRLARATNKLLRTVYLAVRGFFEDECLFRASALTYITVLSLVPLLAFSFAVAKGMGFYHTLIEGTIRPYLDRTFGLPVPEAPLLANASAGAQEMRQAIDRVLDFVDRTDLSGLGALGLVLLVYTVIKLLSTIEESFNDIWGVQRARSLVRKVTDYLAMLVVAPILLFAAAGIMGAAENSAVLGYLNEELHVGLLLKSVLGLAPLISLWIAFAFVYIAMPNARTRWSSALIGAVVGGSLWQLALLLLIEFQLGIARYNAIYAGFAAIPVFLVWVQFSWVAVLLGAEVCFAHQSASSYYPDSPTSANLRARESIALRLLARVAARSLRAEPPWSAAGLARELNISLRPIELVLSELVDGGLLAVVRGHGPDVFLLARDLDRIQVKTVLDVLRGPLLRSNEAARTELDDELAACLVGLDEAQAESRHNLPLRSLAEQGQAPIAEVPERASSTELGRTRQN